MPTKRQTPPPTPPPPVSIPISEDPGGWDDLLAHVEDGASVEIHVYQEPERGQGGAAYAFTAQPDEYTWPQLMDRIKADPDLGPGLYSLRIRRGTHWIGRRNIRIAGRPRPPGQAPAAPSPAADPLAAVREMQAAQTQFMQQLVLALVGGKAGGGASITDVIAAAKMLTEGRSDPPDPVEQIRRAFELRKLFAPEPEAIQADGGDDWLAALVKTFGPKLADIATRPATPPAPPAALPAPARPAVVGVRAAPPAPAADVPEPIRQFVGMLLRGAETGADPGPFGRMAADQLGEHAAALLMRPDIVSVLTMIEPRVGGHLHWFGRVIDAARLTLQAPPEAPAEPAPGLTKNQPHLDVAEHVSAPSNVAAGRVAA